MASNSQPPKLYTALALKMYETAAISSLPDDSVIALESTFEPEKRDSNRFFSDLRGMYTLVECPALDDKELASKIEILYADLPILARYRHNLTSLKWVHTAWNGVDTLMQALDPNEPLPSYKLTKTLGTVNAALITEYVIGYIITLERHIFPAKDSQSRREWKPLQLAASDTLSKITIGILGVGGIGKHMAKICKAFGMTVWGLTRRPPTPESRSPDVDVYKSLDGLPELLQNCDYICNLLPSTPGTVNLLSGDILANCKQQKCVFINVARGDIIDEASFIKAIKNGWLSGAVLDVYVKEPIPPESEVWNLPGVIITPHVSGWSTHASHLQNVNECFVRNYHHYVAGEPLESLLDWKQGY